MKKRTITIFLILLLSTTVFSHRLFDYSVEGDYRVGKTSCTIQWDNVDQVYKVYWKEGIGYTVLQYKEELPNGNIVYDEYQSNGRSYTGTFTFKNYKYLKGEYERVDGKKFKVNKQ